MNAVVGFGGALSAAGPPQGSFAYNGFNGSSHISIVCTDINWNWWPNYIAFGVIGIVIGW